MTLVRRRPLLGALIVILAVPAAATSLPAAASSPLDDGSGYVIVDAQADPTNAAAALEQFDPNNAYNQFEPTSAPQYSHTTWQPAADTAVATLPGKPSTSLTIQATHTSTYSHSLQNSVDVAVSTSLASLVTTEVSGDFTLGKKWSSTHGYSQSVAVTATPGHVVSVLASNSQVELTGDYTFTGKDGISYRVLNMDQTLPADNPKDGAGEPGTEVNYLVYSQPYTSNGTTSVVPGSDGTITLSKEQLGAVAKAANAKFPVAAKPTPRYQPAIKELSDGAPAKGPLSATTGVNRWPGCPNGHMYGQIVILQNRTPWPWTFDQGASQTKTGGPENYGQATGDDGQPCWVGHAPNHDVVLPGQDVAFSESFAPILKNDETWFTRAVFSYTDPGDGVGPVEGHVIRADSTDGIGSITDFLVPPDVHSSNISGAVNSNNTQIERIFLNSPRTVTIDNATDPAGAAAAAAFFTDPNTTDKSFTPSTTFTHTVDQKGTRTSARLINASDAPATLGNTNLTSSGESTTMDWSVSTKVSVGFEGIGNASLTDKVAGGQTWTTDVANSSTVQTEVGPGKAGWLETRAANAEITGDFTFTAYNITYHLKNITLTEPGVVDPNQPNSPRFINNGNDCKITDPACLPTGMTLQ